ncbi:uncharacterized protein TNCV_2497981 [Trichonephila clavipes]|nr:uncharacterized protein TNCV_2497981 [Trichonephila clavipes]
MMGSTALNMCAVAAGEADAFFQYTIHCWDMAAGKIIAEEIGVSVIHPEDKNGTIPKSNPHLLHAELKNKIPRHDKITHMYFTRSGKIKISTSDPICAVQITAIEQILNIPVKANIIWEGFTSRFLLFDIPPNIHLTDVATELKNSNDIEIVEIRRFIKKNSRQEASPVLITILGINTPECVKLWFFNHRALLFIDKSRQCNNCYSFTHSSRFCPSDVRCINCVEDLILDNVQTLQIAQTVKEIIQQTLPIVPLL